MPEFSSLDRPEEDPTQRVVVFIGGPWDMTIRPVPVQWGMTVRAVYPTSPVSVLDVTDNGPRVIDYTLRYLVIAQQLVCVGTSYPGDPTRTDEDRVVQTILAYARKGMINERQQATP